VRALSKRLTEKSRPVGRSLKTQQRTQAVVRAKPAQPLIDIASDVDASRSTLF